MPTTPAQFYWFWGTTAGLTAALYFPVYRIIWVLRVRRLEKKLERKSTDEERETLRQKTRLISAVIAICFAYLFNKTLSLS